VKSAFLLAVESEKKQKKSKQKLKQNFTWESRFDLRKKKYTVQKWTG